MSESRSVVSNSLWLHELYSPLNSPGQNTGVGSLSHLQGIFPSQGSKPGLPHCRQILHQLSHQGSPRITGVGRLSLLQGIFLTQESNTSFAIFFHSIGCLLILLMIFFSMQKLLCLIMSHSFIFAFIAFALEDWSKEIMLWFMSKYLAYVLF